MNISTNKKVVAYGAGALPGAILISSVNSTLEYRLISKMYKEGMI